MASNYQLQTYIAVSSSTPQGPYLIPPSFPATPTSPLQINIQNVAGSGVTANNCGIATGGQNTDFSLQWSSAAPYYAQVIVQPTNVYSDDPAARQTLMQSFTAFCVALQQLELAKSPQCLIPGGAAVIANWVAASLPLRVDEILFYYYGFNPTSNYIDLQPGMRLRIETGAYQYIPTSPTLSAFTAQSQAHYAIARSSNQQLYFDPYLNALLVNITPTSPPQVGNLVDLATLGSRRYFRLIYPSSLNNPTKIYSQPGLSQNVVLLGADTSSDLANATQNYLNTKTCTTAAPGNQPIICAYFTGRTTVVPEIPISYLGQLNYVAIGTTIQNLIDFYNVMPSNQVNQSAPFFLYRNCADGLSAKPQYGQKIVNMGMPTQYVPTSTGGFLTQWDLPLVKGDSITASGWQ
jgi:hypothetical protein